MYATAAQLLDRYSATEIAQRADTAIPPQVDGELLAKAAQGDDLTGHTPAQQAAATVALNRVERALRDADSTIDCYLASRYATPVTQAAEVLERIACQLARYFLYDDGATSQVQSHYSDAVAFLREIAAGSVQLGASTNEGAA